MEDLKLKAFEEELAKVGVTIIPAEEIVKEKPYIGEGGFGKVYRGKYKDVTVALKKIKIDENKNSDYVFNEILNEIKVVLQAKHEKIPLFFGLWKPKAHYHLVFEFIKGKNLKDIYADKSEQERLQIIYDVCCILEDLHKLKLIHRDIKPANVMITEDKKTMLIDFGISKIAKNTITFTKNQIGTIPYMSPEIYDVDLEGNEEDELVKVSTKSDIWALGCMLSELISGVLPWSNWVDPKTGKKKKINDFSIIKFLSQQLDFPIPGNLNQELKDLLTNIMIHTPEDRPPASEVRQIIEKLLNDEKRNEN